MGIIRFALVAGGFYPTVDNIPLWVRLSCALAMGLGTAVGGWKIIKTVGGKFMKIEPVNGVFHIKNILLVCSPPLSGI